MTEIRSISLDDLPRASAFDQKVDRPVNTTFAPDFYSWQYFHSAGKPHEESPACAAWVDQNMVATAMLSDMDVWIENQLYPGGFLHEWYADPASGFAGLELIGSVLKKLPMIIGAGPSLVSMLTFKRIRPLAVIPLQRLIMPLDPQRCAALSFEQHPHLVHYLRSVMPSTRQPNLAKVVPLQHLDTAYDAAWLQMRQGLQVAANRTAQYMNWRYVQHPRFTYQMARIETDAGDAYVFWRVETPPGHDVSVIRVCDAIGSADALVAAIPALCVHWQQLPNIAFADFYCSNDSVCAALLEGGFSHALVMPGMDLPRLFSPLQNDIRKTLYFYLSYSRELAMVPRFEPGRSYLTKGDSNQDRPNP